MVELFTPSIAIVTQLKKLHHFSHLALETSLQCNCSSKYSAGYRGGWVVQKNLKAPLRNIKMAPNKLFKLINYESLNLKNVSRHLFQSFLTK